MAEPERIRRLWYLGAVAAVAVAFAGFLTGTRTPPETEKPPTPEGAASGVVPAYGDIGALRRGANAGMYADAFEKLRPEVDPFAEVEQSEEDHARVLAARAERRAYDGAPPTIPHAIDQRQFPDCLVCHEKGAVVAGKRAPVMSHARYDSCTQCHAPSTGPPVSLSLAVDNTFEGAPSPGRLEKPWPGAPPLIPHPTLMRSECTSCHGPLGAHGIRTTHPWRQSCTQCHAPSAELDQRAGAASHGGIADG